jgi:hypothetical protein
MWPNEAADFTPWLASRENIGELSRAIGIELEADRTEVACGPFSADILARDTGTGDLVVIENQLAKTNHDHLGKALTYAAHLGARVVVWIAPVFTDEHRKALDWLNDNSSDDLSFYGVQIELWAIDQSRPAVRFNVVSRPTHLVPRSVIEAAGELSDTKRLQLDWWTAFRQALEETKALSSTHSPRPQYWYNVALGRTGMFLSCTANVYDGVIGVRLYLQAKYGGQSALLQLMDSREAIELELGAALNWNPNPEAQDKVVTWQRPADLQRRDLWPEHLRWLVDATLKMRTVFGPRVKALQLEAPSETEDQ